MKFGKMQSGSYYYLEDFVKKIGDIECELQDILADNVEVSRDFSIKCLLKRLDMMKAIYNSFLEVERSKDDVCNENATHTA